MSINNEDIDVERLVYQSSVEGDLKSPWQVIRKLQTE